MKKNIITFVAIGLMAFFAAGFSCSFTTANISKLDFGKNEKGDQATTTFSVGEKIYSIATISNTSSKHKINFVVTADNVSGKKKGDEVYNQKIDFEGARPVWLAFNVANPGDYKVDANLLDEDGKQIDSKSGTITVKGAPMAPAASDADDKKADDKTGDKKKTDEDEDEE
jgi:hypothetical protein